MTPAEIFSIKEKFIDKNELELAKNIEKLQEKLWMLISKNYIPDFNITEDGSLNLNNMSKAIALDSIFNQFTSEFQSSVFKTFSNELLKVADFSEEYFMSMGFDKAIISRIAKQTNFISKQIGIDKAGEVIKGSYLDRLAQAQNVRDELKNYVINNVTVKRNLKEFQTGFRDLVLGTDEVEGKLVRYHRQYSYDTFNQVSQAADNFYAEALDLNYFIYQGTLIKTSRCFCIKRKGKVFHRDDLNTWKNDISLIGDKNTYNALIERGRYNCRHRYRWISDELALQKGYDEDEVRVILKERCKKIIKTKKQ